MILEFNDQQNVMLAAIINSSNDAIISKDINSIITTWNKAAERIFGYDSSDAVGRHISFLIPTELAEEESVIMSNIRAGKTVEHYQTIRQTKSGRRINISLTISPIRNAAGTIIGASKIARDITKQKEAEEQISRHAESLEIINSIGRIIVSELNLSTVVQKVTNATTNLCSAMFGSFYYDKHNSNVEVYTCSSEEGLTSDGEALFKMPVNKDIFQSTFGGKGVFICDDISRDPGCPEIIRQYNSGTKRICSYMAVPVIAQSGRIIGGLFFGHPRPGVFTPEHGQLVTAIALQAAIALENAKLYEEIKMLNQRKDDFIGFASHELNTPLTSIKSYLQLAEQAPELTTQLFPKVLKQVKRLSAIIADLLNVSRIESGKLTFAFRWTSLFTVIQESIETVEQFAGQHVIERVLPAKDIMVWIDPQKMGQLIINLLTNAIKYSPGKTSVQLAVLYDEAEVRISVTDRGIGMDPQHFQRIFMRYYRVPETRSSIQGLGIGLYLSQEIIKGHNGKIWVESDKGNGSVFYISFPRANTSV